VGERAGDKTWNAESALHIVHEEVCACRKCPRLVNYREKVAREKRRAFREWIYWGRGVPGFGDAHAKLFILGLAPAAHGGNRTGRVFTGDRSGDFLYGALWRAEPSPIHDGAKLHEGDRVVVERVNGLTLRVRRAEEWELNP